MTEQLADLTTKASSPYGEPLRLPYVEAAEQFDCVIEGLRQGLHMEGVTSDADIALYLSEGKGYKAISPELHEPMMVFISKWGNDQDLPSPSSPTFCLSYSQEFMNALLDNEGGRFVAIHVESFVEAGTRPTAHDVERLMATNNPDSTAAGDIYEAVCKYRHMYEGDITFDSSQFQDCLRTAPKIAYDYLELFDVVEDRDTFLRFMESNGMVAQKVFEDHTNGDRFKDITHDRELAIDMAGRGIGQAIEVAQLAEMPLNQEFAELCVASGLGDTVLSNLAYFKDVSRNFTLELLAQASSRKFIPSPNALRSTGVKLDSKFADFLIATPAGSEWFLDGNFDEFDGLSVDHLHKIIDSGERYSLYLVFESPEAFDGLEINSEFAELLARSRNGLVNLANNLHCFFDLNGELLEKLLELEPEHEIKDVSGLLGAAALSDMRRQGREKQLREHLFRFEGVGQTTIDRLFVHEDDIEAFPGGGTAAAGWSREQHEWFGRNRYTETLLGTDWSNEQLGQIIGTRLRLGLADNLHDASYWLDAFDVPKAIEDIAYILEHRFDDDFDAEQLSKIRLYDVDLEKLVLRNIMTLPYEVRYRLSLSSKPGTEAVLFYGNDYQIMYRALVDSYEGEPLFKHEDLSTDLLLSIVAQRFNDGIYTLQGVNGSMNIQDILQNITELLNEDHEDSLVNALSMNDVKRDSIRILGKAIQELKQLGNNRKDYVNEVTRWLKVHAAMDQKKLVKVWSDRAYVLANSVVTASDGQKRAEADDNVSSILAWQNEKAFAHHVRALVKMSRGNPDQHREELKVLDMMLGPEKAEMRAELLRVLSVSHTAIAIMKYEEWKTQRTGAEQLLPARSIAVPIKNKNFRFEIFSKDDPRGFTIGEDTGCCMTLTGAAVDCLEVGYTHHNAGFMAVYTPAGDIAAQSFWYIHPDYPDILVLDNIEANKGRDYNKILDVYEAGLRVLLNELGNTTKIRKVHVGEDNTDADLSMLPPVVPVPPLTDDILTDAENQRLLLNLDTK